MTTLDMKRTLQQLKKDLWKGIPMSRESEKTYKKFMSMCDTPFSNYPVGESSKWKEMPGLGMHMNLGDMRDELRECAERDKNAGGKCGLMCQIRKRKK